MKIALIIENMDTARGGRETSTAQIASALAEKGQDVTILCQQGSHEDDRVKVCELGRTGLLRISRLRNFIEDIQHHISETPYDIIHTTLPIPGANVYQLRSGTYPAQSAAGIRRRSLAEKPFAVVAAMLKFRHHELMNLERRLMAEENVLCLPVSQMVAEEIHTYYGRTENVRVIYNGVQTPDPNSRLRADWRQKLRYRMGLKPQDVVFLTVARNFALKGVAETIIAFAKWYHRSQRRVDARLVVIGHDFPEGYQRHASLRDVGPKVIFLPQTDEIFPWYAAADACVLLSWYDPCSRTLLEAARWCIPSITTIYNGASEILVKGAGIVVSSPRDRRAIVAAMDELADPDGRRMRAAACAALSAELSLERHVDELIQAYADLVGRK